MAVKSRLDINLRTMNTKKCLEHVINSFVHHLSVDPILSAVGSTSTMTRENCFLCLSVSVSNAHSVLKRQSHNVVRKHIFWKIVHIFT